MTVAMLREDWLIVLGLALGAGGLGLAGWWLSRPPVPRRGGLYGKEWGR